MHRRKTAAGSYEQERYEQGLLAFRTRVLPRLRLVTLPVFLGCLAYDWFGPASKVQFVAGLLAGGAFTLYVWVRDEPPHYVRYHLEGAQGERATEKVLWSLEAEGWHVTHNIDTGRGNRDHVVVGPPGVFLLDSKKWGGRISVDGDSVRVERLDDTRDGYRDGKLAGALRAEASRLKQEIETSTGVRTWVTAVVVFWSPFDQRIVEGDRVFFLHGDELVDWLRGRDKRLNDDVRRRIAEALL
jgi:hypothetical protein